MPKTQTLSDQEVIENFVIACKTVDIKRIEGMLADTGEYDVQDDALEAIVTDKSTFLIWFKQRLEQTKIESVDYDNCLYCNIGCPVVLFNKGEFPRRARSLSENSTTGLRIGVGNGSINRVQFCNNLVRTETQFEFERVGHKIVDLTKKGVSFHEAYSQVTGKPFQLPSPSEYREIDEDLEHPSKLSSTGSLNDDDSIAKNENASQFIPR